MRVWGAVGGSLLVGTLVLATTRGTTGQVPERSRSVHATLARGGVAADPAEVVAGMFYTGATVRVSAVVPAGAEVAMVCRGETHPLVLKRKGKALGLIWMNVGEVSFQAVPEVYLLRTSAPLSRLASAPVLEDLDLGFTALAARSQPTGGQASLFGELVRLKQRDQLWEMAEGTVQVQEATEDGAALATTDFRLPVRARAGVYRVQVYAFDGGQGELLGSAEVRVTQGGTAALITSLAARHGLLYGILATLIAMAVGLLTGMVFGLGSKGGH